MQTIMVSLFPLIALIVLGNLLKRTSILTPEFWNGAEKLNYYLFFPAMLFINLAHAQIELNLVKSIVMMLSITICILCICLFLIKKILKIPVARFGVYTQSNVRFNTYIGLAIIASLLPAEGMTIFAIILAISIPVVNIISVLALTEQDGMNVKAIMMSLIKNPLIMGCVVGILFNYSGFVLWEGTERFIHQLALCSLPLGLMCVGAALQFMELKKDVLPIALNTLSRMVIVPILAYYIALQLGLDKIQLQVFVIYFALPTASASYILTKVLRGDSQLMAAIISLQTLCAAITLPLILTFIL